MHAPCGACDDTALNGIELVCTHPSRPGVFKRHRSSYAPWGPWMATKNCKSGYFVSGFRLDVHTARTDQTGAANLAVKCRTLYSYWGQYILDGKSGIPWVSTKYWSSSCPLNSAVCGLRTRVEKWQRDGDDTALNNVEMYCCKCD